MKAEEASELIYYDRVYYTIRPKSRKIFDQIPISEGTPGEVVHEILAAADLLEDPRVVHEIKNDYEDSYAVVYVQGWRKMNEWEENHLISEAERRAVQAQQNEYETYLRLHKVYGSTNNA